MFKRRLILKFDKRRQNLYMKKTKINKSLPYTDNKTKGEIRFGRKFLTGAQGKLELHLFIECLVRNTGKHLN